MILFCVISKNIDNLYKWETFWPKGLPQSQISHTDNNITIGHTEAELLVMIIDKCWKEDAILRKIRESRWIRMLKTSWPLLVVNYITQLDVMCVRNGWSELEERRNSCVGYSLLYQ